MSPRVIQGKSAVRPGKFPMPKARGCTFVIFGATGDLTERKLMPALYRLARERCLGGDFRVLGLSRCEMSDGTFRSKMREAVSEHVRHFDVAVWDRFAERLFYMGADLRACDAQGYPKGCLGIRFYASMALEKGDVGLGRRTAERYNRDYYIGKAYVSDDGESLFFENYLMIEGGVTAKNLEENLDNFLAGYDSLMEVYEELQKAVET